MSGQLFESLTGGGSLDLANTTTATSGAKLSNAFDSSGWTVATGKASAGALPSWVWGAGLGLAGLGLLLWFKRGR